MRPWRFRYISNALAERSTAAHWMSSNVVPTSAAVGSRRKYFTSRMRDVLSARSSMRPSRQKCQLSSWVIVASVTPANRWPAILTDAEQILRVGPAAGVGGGRIHHQVELVELLPHLRRDDLAHRAGVLAGGPQAGEDRVGVLRIEGEELDDVAAGWPRRSASRIPPRRPWSRPAAATAARRRPAGRA